MIVPRAMIAHTPSLRFSFFFLLGFNAGGDSFLKEFVRFSEYAMHPWWFPQLLFFRLIASKLLRAALFTCFFPRPSSVCSYAPDFGVCDGVLGALSVFSPLVRFVLCQPSSFVSSSFSFYSFLSLF